MQPTEEQLVALDRFRGECGRRWKHWLHVLWLLDTPVQDAALLRQLRNNFGPEWLAKYRPGDQKVAWLMPATFEVPYAASYRWADGWRLAHQDGKDMIQPYCRSKAEARALARSLKITLLD